MTDEKTRVNVEMPDHLHNAVMRELPHGKFSEEVRSLAQRLAFGEEIAEDDALRAELENVRAEIDDVDATMTELRAKRKELENKEKRIEKKVDKQAKQQQKHEGQIEMLEGELRAGQNLDEGDGRVKRAADSGRMKPEHVIEKLRNRNPEVPDYAFETNIPSQKKWDGVRDRD